MPNYNKKKNFKKNFGRNLIYMLISPNLVTVEIPIMEIRHKKHSLKRICKHYKILILITIDHQLIENFRIK